MRWPPKNRTGQQGMTRGVATKQGFMLFQTIFLGGGESNNVKCMVHLLGDLLNSKLHCLGW